MCCRFVTTRTEQFVLIEGDEWWLYIGANSPPKLWHFICVNGLYFEIYKTLVYIYIIYCSGMIGGGGIDWCLDYRCKKIKKIKKKCKLIILELKY